MGLGNLWLLTLFSLFIFFNSGSSFSDKPPSEANQQNTILKNQENEIPFSSSESSPELDTIPIVNPTTPGTTPTPIIDPPSPPAPISMEPGINPTTPTTVPTTNIPASSGGTWCIANPTASPTALQVAIDYACGYGGADCLGIQPGAGCYEPNTLKDHASYAFNDYYQKNPAPTSCVFGGTAQLTFIP